MQFPDKFSLKTGRGKNTRIPLPHHVKTTSDFFKFKPLLCREVVPGDDFDVEMKSFVRMTPMPRPTFGRIKFHNRAFFVPYRTVMEGFTHFIEDINYPTAEGLVKIQRTPYFTNADVADVLLSLSNSSSNDFYWRGVDSYPTMKVMVSVTGNICVWRNGSDHLSFFQKDDGTIEAYVWSSIAKFPFSKFIYYYDDVDCGTYTVSSNKFVITDSQNSKQYYFVGTPGSRPGVYTGYFDKRSGESDVYPDISEDDFSKVTFDFFFGGKFYQFSPTARRFYGLLISLGYRVSFRYSGSAGSYAFSDTTPKAAGKLLAFVKVYLDWYYPAQYSQSSSLQMLFYGVSSSGRQITQAELMEIADIDFACYDRDYFTSAWSNPAGPTVADSHVSLVDTSVVTRGGSDNYRDRVVNYDLTNSHGSKNGTPTVVPASTGATALNNLSYYMIESLRALSNMMRRHQLAGYRAIDRYLADRGYKISDDRISRSYWLGSQSYDAEIGDIMSTADTDGAPLGEYAGKGIAYTDQEGNNHFKLDNSEEFGFFIIVSSIVPETGYVQGEMRENLHLNRLDFFQGDFDNIGTQPIQVSELFYDEGMKSFADYSVMSSDPGDQVFGFTPRYAEYKIGYDFLTGDFAIPSRREGMDSFHLYRLFRDGDLDSINQGFCVGENEQYDRIFNNVDPSYDHFYMDHYIFINAYRPMKSLTDVYDFEHSDGNELSVDANGTIIN